VKIVSIKKEILYFDVTNPLVHVGG
jgi:hypothetical protein